MFDVLIKNAKIVSSQEIIEGNLYIRDEKIAAVSRDLLDEGAAKVIDAAGKYAMPGVVDEHVHIIDMGQPELGKYELDCRGRHHHRAGDAPVHAALHYAGKLQEEGRAGRQCLHGGLRPVWRRGARQS